MPRLSALAVKLGDVIVDAAFVRQPHGRVLRITIDKQLDPGGITLTDCETFHRALIPLVESIDYDTLEVESPGADRPIKTDLDWDRSINTIIELNLYKADQGAKHHVGRLKSVNKGVITLETKNCEREFDRSMIAIARPYVSLEKINTQDNDSDRRD